MARFSADLVEDLGRRRVVLFLGSGVSASATPSDGVRYQTWDEFLRAQTPELDAPRKQIATQLLDQKQYLEACEVIREGFDDHEWRALCEKEFLRTAAPSKLHEALVRLDQRIVLTTNFDKLYESAWASLNTDKTRYPILKTAVDEDLFDCLRRNDDYIIKIHGSIDDSQNMIFSYRDYARNAFGNVRYNDFLVSLLVNYTFLFVGFSLKDPAVKGAVQRYATSFPRCRPHYVFSSENLSDIEKELHKKYLRISVIDYDSSNSHEMLVEHINELAELAQLERKEMLARDLK